jgi:hypothetical protein
MLAAPNPFDSLVVSSSETAAAVDNVGKSTIQENKAAGDAFRDQVADQMRSAGREVQTEVQKATPFGPRVVDIEVSHQGQVLGGIETKLGASPYTASQRAKDAYLRLFRSYPTAVVRKPKT